MSLRKTCEVCGKHLISVSTGKEGNLWIHPEAPCSGLTDAVSLTLEVDDESLQKLWDEKYSYPKYSDYELLNMIWKNNLLRWLIEHIIK